MSHGHSHPHHAHGSYHLPDPSYWPIVGSVGLFLLMVGAGNWLHNNAIGPYLFVMGAAILIVMMVGWFGTVIRESLAGLHNEQVERSYRLGMVWFIFSEVMFFGAFFGALFYVRRYAVPELGGEGDNLLTNYLLWPAFHATWPLLKNPSALFAGPKQVMEAWGIPALNTFILLSSGATITVAHWGLLSNKRKQLIIFLAATVALGCLFLSFQAHEYWVAYKEYGLTLGSGIYGTTFFMLTGFHGMHVTLGTIMLIVILGRCIKGHFDPKHHFAFEAVAWYWHFVDVVWLFLFVFVYWI